MSFKKDNFRNHWTFSSPSASLFYISLICITWKTAFSLLLEKEPSISYRQLMKEFVQNPSSKWKKKNKKKPHLFSSMISPNSSILVLKKKKRMVSAHLFLFSNAKSWVMSLLVPRFIKVKSGYNTGREYNGTPCCNSNINDSLGDILPSGCSWNNLNLKCHSTFTKIITQ